jgi:D-threonate/D-erythronate kinase
MSLWTILSDDLTGLQAIAGEFARLGLRVGTAISQLPTRAELDRCDVYGFDTATRPLAAADAEMKVGLAVQHLLSVGARQFFKHNDSILQGHVGVELRAMVRARGDRPIVYVPACPNRGRVTQSGIQLEVDAGGNPVAGGLRQDLRGCISDRTGLSTLVIERAVLHAGNAASAIATARCDVLIADASTDEDLDLIISAADEAGCQVLAGSVGLAAALARAHLPQRRIAAPVVVVAGSLQAATRQQVAELLARPRCTSIELNPREGQSQAGVATLAQRMREALFDGMHCVVSATRAPLDGTLPAVYPALAPHELSAMGRSLRALLAEVIADPEVPLGGLVLAGGTTADLTLRDVLRVTRFTGLGWLCEGMTIAIAADGARPGLPVVTKSGGWGAAGALGDAIDRLGVCRAFAAG